MVSVAIATPLLLALLVSVVMLRLVASLLWGIPKLVVTTADPGRSPRLPGARTR